MTTPSYEKHTTSTDALDSLGSLIDEGEKRDAIHLAVEPVTAGMNLRPGDHVVLVDGVAMAAGIPGDGVGIVDPFIIDAWVPAGSMFWLVVYPWQISSLRHVWEHPSFPPSGETDTTPRKVTLANLSPNEVVKAQAEDWLRTWHSTVDVPWGFEETIRQIEEADDEYIIAYGDDASGSIPPEFYEHYALWKGRQFSGRIRPERFSCSC